MASEPFQDTGATPAVRGHVHRPAKAGGDAVVLTHGAGGNCNAPLLVALCEAFAQHGFVALRCDLPYRQARPSGPPRGSDKEDRAGLRRAVEVVRKEVRGRVFLGGISYGGRQATMLVAEEPQLADGLLVLSYPLHPPGKPEQLRTKHLPHLRVPALFVSGDKDPFGSPEELAAAVKLVPGTPRLMIVEGAGHDLGYGKRAKSKSAELPQRIREAFLKMVG
ncbi:MAG TPA: alpha/beta family hydrolase [Terriglobales bacterium]|nr:alpha/beta family hydrolase [Terriglobales bacterium]